jgi:hypothetical protein
MSELTREQVLNMKPGQELDALIAEKVMGLPAPEESKINGRWVHHFIKETYPGSGVFEENTSKMELLKDYSTDISAAWGVVEKLSKNIGCFYMWQHVDYASVDCGAKCDAKTMPETICKAALLAVMNL